MGASSAGNRRTLASAYFLWRALGAVVLGVLLAKWSWALFAPHPEAVFVVREQGSAVESGHLFGVVVSAVPQAEVVVLPNVQLVGVFAAGAGKPGFAVLRLDGKQVGVAVGESVVPGTKLLEVHPDYVFLERTGVQQRVDLEGSVAGAAGAGVVSVVR